MKNKLFLGFIAFFSILNLASCDVEPLDPQVVEDPGGNPTEPGSFMVDYDGSTYTALTTQVYISGGSILLTALRADGDSFGFIIDGTTVGNYAANANLLAFTESGSQYGWQSINPDAPTEDTGSVTITEIDTENHTISGTFHFKGYWSNMSDDGVAPKEFTDGVFTALPYVDQSPTGDTFTATVDGTAFEVTDIFATEISAGGTSVISVAGTNGNNNITVSVDSDIAPGTYPITGSLAADHVQVMYQTASGGGGMATFGSVTVTQITADRVKGTFTATIVDGQDTYQITGGSFDVAY